MYSVLVALDVSLVGFMYLVFTRMLGESYHRLLGYVLLCDVSLLC